MRDPPQKIHPPPPTPLGESEGPPPYFKEVFGFEVSTVTPPWSPPRKDPPQDPPEPPKWTPPPKPPHSERSPSGPPPKPP